MLSHETAARHDILPANDASVAEARQHHQRALMTHLRAVARVPTTGLVAGRAGTAALAADIAPHVVAHTADADVHAVVAEHAVGRARSTMTIHNTVPMRHKITSHNGKHN